MPPAPDARQKYLANDIRYLRLIHRGGTTRQEAAIMQTLQISRSFFCEVSALRPPVRKGEIVDLCISCRA
jgi:hypothetical protein